MELELSDEEMVVLLNDILDIYGYDFTTYAKASIKRRINRLFTLDGFSSFAQFRFKLKNDSDYFLRFVEEITVNVTEMFRDPQFYQVLRREVIPALATYPFIRIWHAGCSTGEEVYSMAILLKEANLLHKSIIYATDINPAVVRRAASGILDIAHMKQYATNYILSGGSDEFSNYYTAGNNQVMFDAALRKNIVFSTHNLAADSSFNQFQLIFCRNVMIYFEQELQKKVFNLFDDSLERLGFLALGSKESLRLAPAYHKYREFSKEKIWRKVG